MQLGSSETRKARLEIHPVEGSKNSLQYWAQVLNPLRVSYNFCPHFTRAGFYRPYH